MSFFDSRGRPDPTGAYQLQDGKLVLRPGHTASFDLMLCDAKTEAAPSSIDEALRRRFAEMAEQQGTDVANLLANMTRVKLEEVASEIAKDFINSVAGGAIAARFTDAQRASIAASATSIASIMCTAAKRGYKPEASTLAVAARDAARRAWLADKQNAYRGPGSSGNSRDADAGAGTGVAFARSARNHRLTTAHRGER